MFIKISYTKNYTMSISNIYKPILYKESVNFVCLCMYVPGSSI